LTSFAVHLFPVMNGVAFVQNSDKFECRVKVQDFRLVLVLALVFGYYGAYSYI